MHFFGFLLKSSNNRRRICNYCLNTIQNKMEQFKQIDLEQIRQYKAHMQRQIHINEYRRNIFWVVIGIIVFAVVFFALIILKIWWDYQQYVKDENDKVKLAEEDTKEMKRLRALEEKYKSGETKQYKWSQTSDEIEIKVLLNNDKEYDPALLKSKDVECVFKQTTLQVKIKGLTILNGTFYDKIIPSESSWQFGFDITNVKDEELVSTLQSIPYTESEKLKTHHDINTKTSKANSQNNNDNVDDTNKPKYTGVRTIELSLKKKIEEDSTETTTTAAGNSHSNRRKIELEPLWEYILREYDGINAHVHVPAASVSQSIDRVSASVNHFNTFYHVFLTYLYLIT